MSIADYQPIFQEHIGNGTSVRYFENREGGHKKFWVVQVAPSKSPGVGYNVKMRWGKIGSNGQLRQLYFFSVAEALKEADKGCETRAKHGYECVATPWRYRLDKVKKADLAVTLEPQPQPIPDSGIHDDEAASAEPDKPRTLADLRARYSEDK